MHPTIKTNNNRKSRLQSTYRHSCVNLQEKSLEHPRSAYGFALTPIHSEVL